MPITIKTHLQLPRQPRKRSSTSAVKKLSKVQKNIKKDKATAISYLQKGLTLDPNDTSIQELLTILQKPPVKQPPPKAPTKTKTVIKSSGTIIKPKGSAKAKVAK